MNPIQKKSSPDAVRTGIREALKNPDVSRETLDLVHGWLLSHKHDETVLQDLFDEVFVFTSKPSRAAYRSWRAIWPRIGKTASRKRLIRLYACRGAAAAAFIAIILGIMFHTTRHTTERTNIIGRTADSERVFVHGTRGIDLPEKLDLPCGSTVWVRGRSRISYTGGAWDSGAERAVKLSGEAFFEVAPGEKPFVVELDECRIQVKGTQFNVKSPEDGAVREIMLVRGRVQVTLPGEKAVALYPLDRLVYRPLTGETELIRAGSGGVYPCANGMLVLDNVGLKEALYAVAVHFDRKIVFTGDPDPDRLVRTILSREQPLEEVLTLLQLVGEFEFELTEQAINVTS